MQALPKGDNFMLISSKGRYTLYVLVDLAKNGQNRYIPLKEILHDINLSIKKGETHVLMGPNGAGKSTLGFALMGSPKYTLNSGNTF